MMMNLKMITFIMTKRIKFDDDGHDVQNGGHVDESDAMERSFFQNGSVFFSQKRNEDRRDWQR